MRKWNENTNTMTMKCSVCNKAESFKTTNYEEANQIRYSVGWKGTKIEDDYYWLCSDECMSEIQKGTTPEARAEYREQEKLNRERVFYQTNDLSLIPEHYRAEYKRKMLLNIEFHHSQDQIPEADRLTKADDFIRKLVDKENSNIYGNVTIYSHDKKDLIALLCGEND